MTNQKQHRKQVSLLIPVWERLVAIAERNHRTLGGQVAYWVEMDAEEEKRMMNELQRAAGKIK